MEQTTWMISKRRYDYLDIVMRGLTQLGGQQCAKSLMISKKPDVLSTKSDGSSCVGNAQGYEYASVAFGPSGRRSNGKMLSCMYGAACE